MGFELMNSLGYGRLANMQFLCRFGHIESLTDREENA